MTTAYVNGPESALKCLRRWPDQAAEVLRECFLGTLPGVQPGCLGQRLLDNRASGGTPQDVIAIYAVSAAASAVQGTGALTVANVHICGEGYAGKSMTRQALMKSYDKSGRVLLSASFPLPDITLKEGRTRGMVRDSLDMVVREGDQQSVVRVLFHDYGGQEEFRANHAAHLAAPNSVYLLVVPLWDKRPKADDLDQSVNKPMVLEYIIGKYRTWLKFINTIVPKQAQVECITVLNFAEQYRNAKGEEELQETVDAVKAVSDEFKGGLVFSHDPILVNAKRAASVHKRIVTPLRNSISKLAHAAIPVSPALQTVLADMQVKDKWPLFSYESDLQALLRAAIREKHSPSAALVSDPAVAEEVVRTIAEITQGMLESRRDIVVFPVQGGGRISINHPNWLTEQLLGSLFNPQKKVKGGDLEAHFLSATKIAQAGWLGLKRSDRQLVDPTLFAKLLHCIGACIPVVRTHDGDAVFCTIGADITEGTVGPTEIYYFPAFITTPMQPSDGLPTATAVERVIRRYEVVDPALAMIPPGYYPALFVAVASLVPAYKPPGMQRDVPKQILLFKDGMVLKVDASYRVIIRGNATDTAFDLEVELIYCDYPGSAFAEMEKIRDLIVNAQDWRSAVQLVEWCVDPEERDWDLAQPTAKYPALVDAGQQLSRGEALFFHGTQRLKPRVDPIVSDVVDRVYRLEDTVQVMQSHSAGLAEEIVAVTQHAAEQDDRIQLTEVGNAQIARELRVVTEDVRAVQGHGVKQDDRIHHAEVHIQLIEADLHQLRRECRDSVRRLLRLHISAPADENCTGFSAVEEAEIDSLWLEAEECAVCERGATLSAQQLQDAAMEECQRLVERERQAVAAELREVQEALLSQEQRLDAVQTVQENARYSVHKVPFLAEVVPAEPKGTWNDAVRRQVCDVLRLYFYCPACGHRAASGRNHHGYLISVPKGWVRTAVVTLEVTLFALQVASLFTPLPLPRLAEIVQYLPVDTSASQVMLDLVAQLQERASDRATESTAQQQVSDWLTAQRQLQAQTQAPPLQAGQAPSQSPQKPVITRSHVAAVRELLIQAKDGIPPDHSGLEFVKHSASEECAWVCVGCQDKFAKEGKKCLKIEVELS
jgi:hypothetical protein